MSPHRRHDDLHSFTMTERVLAIFGLPAESNPAGLRAFPIVTVMLVVITSAISFYLFGDPELAELLAFIPAEKTRFGGLNLLTCFFVHGSLMHLLSNMYCLFIFGDNVEDELGKTRYVLLLVLATLAGSLLSGAVSGNETIPHVGASGGIFGVMIFYLLAFPRARFTYFFFFQFFRVPAWTVLIMYVFFQLFGLAQQLQGLGGVDYLAHIGGGACGLFFFVLGRRRSRQAP